jgi:hypothetical protein
MDASASLLLDPITENGVSPSSSSSSSFSERDKGGDAPTPSSSSAAPASLPTEKPPKTKKRSRAGPKAIVPKVMTLTEGDVEAVVTSFFNKIAGFLKPFSKSEKSKRSGAEKGVGPKVVTGYNLFVRWMRDQYEGEEPLFEAAAKHWKTMPEKDKKTWNEKAVTMNATTAQEAEKNADAVAKKSVPSPIKTIVKEKKVKKIKFGTSGNKPSKAVAAAAAAAPKKPVVTVTVKPKPKEKEKEKENVDPLRQNGNEDEDDEEEEEEEEDDEEEDLQPKKKKAKPEPKKAKAKFVDIEASESEEEGGEEEEEEEDDDLGGFIKNADESSSEEASSEEDD